MSHPNPWDSKDGAWACSCEGCAETRKAWPDTTAMWKPLAGHDVSFGTQAQRPPQDCNEASK